MSTAIEWQRLQTADELAELKHNAAEDDHVVVLPSWVARKDGRIVGYYSDVSPTVYLWSDSKRVTPRDSLENWKFMEASFLANGCRFITMPCAPQSPYAGLMDRRGYTFFGNTGIYVKDLKGQ